MRRVAFECRMDVHRDLSWFEEVVSTKIFFLQIQNCRARFPDKFHLSKNHKQEVNKKHFVHFSFPKCLFGNFCFTLANLFSEIGMFFASFFFKEFFVRPLWDDNSLHLLCCIWVSWWCWRSKLFPLHPHRQNDNFDQNTSGGAQVEARRLEGD